MATDAFKIIEQREIPELHATGIFAEHKKTGLQLFHLLNDDSENWFSFGFATPQENSTGVPHIIEHTVLCGSKYFNLKDPFLTVMRQNITTFLNAMTFPDKTIYPSSSIIEEEYFTVMRVYGDAVFFPNLDKRSFEQEGHRFEVDEHGEVSIQGVVFNEMLANYSNFNGVAYDAVLRSFFKDSIYEHDSGGDPRYIPDLTYEQFKNFHKQFYHPVNCRLFLVGNIPTEKQMDFIDEHFLKFFEPAPRPSIIESAKKFSSPKKFLLTAPPANEDDNLKTLISLWAVGDTSNTKELLLNKIIASILIGTDGAELSKPILESKLGEIFQWSGIDDSHRDTLFNFGVSKIKKGEEETVEKLIYETLEKIANSDISSEKIETALNQLEFENKEIVRSYGERAPFAMILTEKVYSSWMYGRSPFDAMNYISIFEKLRTEILSDSKYIQKEIRKRFLDNTHRCIAVITPDKTFSDDLKKSIDNRIQKFAEQLSEQEKKDLQIKREEDEKAKLTGDDESVRNLIPHLSPKNLPAINDIPEKTFTHIANIPAIMYQQNTNGITYINIAIPFDSIPDNQYEYLNLYSECIIQMGTTDKRWDEVLNEQSRILGSLTTRIVTCSTFDNFTDLDKQTVIKKEYLKKREWIIIGTKVLQRFMEEGVQFITNLLHNISFNDTDRLHDILKQLKTSYENIAATGGDRFVLSRSLATLNDDLSHSERLIGITQFDFIKNLIKQIDNDKNFLTEISHTLKTIHNEILKNGLLLHLTGDDTDLKKMQNCLEKNLTHFVPLTEKKEVTRHNMFALDKNVTKKLQLLPAQLQVGHSAFSFTFLPYECERHGKLSVFKNWLSSGLLWEQIRMIGGAYGAWAVLMDSVDIFSFVTYRDPNPLNSLCEIEKILHSILEKDVSVSDMEKLIVGAYGSAVIPKSPYSKSYSDFLRILNGKPATAKQEELKGLTKTTIDDLKEFAKMLLEDTRKAVATVIANKEYLDDTSLVKNQFSIITTENSL